MDLPPGFRFHPTDEELITHYLSNKVLHTNFSATAIGEVDMNKVEPWELPRLAKMGEKEWYFFCLRDKKYPTGMRTNRATAGGYWKATGKDKEIFRQKFLVGMKKTLVFYQGRAPKGAKTNWVIHEYRLQGQKVAKNEWVICRVFHKNSKSHNNEVVSSSSLPPLMESPKPKPIPIIHVPCFSNFPQTSNDEQILRGLFHQNMKLERDMVNGSQDTGLSTEMNTEISSVMSNFEMGNRRFDDQIDMDCFWNY